MLVMPKESFLFVPYHAGISNLADIKLANSDARSHAAAVSRQRRDNKRLRTQLGLHNLTTAVSLPAESPQLKEVDVTHDKPQLHDSSSPTDETPTDGKNETRVQRRQHMRAMQFSWRAGNAATEITITSEPHIRPLDLTPRDDFAGAAIDYFTQVISPVNQPIYAIFNVTNIYTSYWIELMQSLDYRPVGVAMVGAIMQRICNPTARVSEDVKSNQALAISKLQRKYADAINKGKTVADDISIITVLGLANLARFLGDTKAYEKHRSNLKSMVFSRGGLDALGHDGLVAASVSQWDSFWTIQHDGTPLFSDSRESRRLVYPAFPLSADLRETFVKLPVGFQSLILKGRISVELIDVLGRIADVSTDGIKALSPGNMWHSTHRKYRDFLEACPTLATPDSAQTIIEKDLTLALFLYCANAFTSARSSTSLFGASRSELTRLLLKEEETQYSLQEQECLYWICAVCVDSWRSTSPRSSLLPEGEKLAAVLKRMKNALVSTNVLQRFFFTPELVESCEQWLETGD